MSGEFFNGSARGKGDVIRKSKQQQERREQRRADRAARRGERKKAGEHGAPIDYSLSTTDAVAPEQFPNALR